MFACHFSSGPLDGSTTMIKMTKSQPVFQSHEVCFILGHPFSSFQMLINEPLMSVYKEKMARHCYIFLKILRAKNEAWGVKGQ